MPSDAKLYRVFIASPGGLDQERHAFKEALSECNDSDAVERGALFLPVGWELTLPGCGRPQGLINQDIEKCDYFVLVLWDRWGSPTDSGNPPKYTSGIEEEYHVALKCFGDSIRPMRQLIVLFKSVELRQLSDPGAQLGRVLEFKAALETEKKLLFDTFDDVNSLKQKLRRNLSAWLRDHERGITGKVTKPELPAHPSRAEVEDTVLSESSDLVRRVNPSRSYIIAGENVLAQNAARGDSKSLIKYAEMLLSAGRFSQANGLLGKALKQTLEPDKRARVLRDLARLNLQLFNHAESEKLFIEAMGILGSLPNKEQDLAGVVMEIGNVYRATARYADAEGYMRRALELRENIKPQNADIMAYVLYSLANIFLQQSRYREARPFAERGWKCGNRSSLRPFFLWRCTRFNWGH